MAPRVGPSRWPQGSVQSEGPMWTGSWLSHLGSGHASAGGAGSGPIEVAALTAREMSLHVLISAPDKLRQVCSWALEKAGWEIKPRLKPHGRVCLPAWFGDPELLLFPPRDRAGLAMLGCGPKVTWKLGCRPQSPRQRADARQLTVAFGHGWGCPTSSRDSLRGGTRCFQSLGAARPWGRRSP